MYINVLVVHVLILYASTKYACRLLAAGKIITIELRKVALKCNLRTEKVIYPSSYWAYVLFIKSKTEVYS